jgi:hypothetical protein
MVLSTCIYHERIREFFLEGWTFGPSYSTSSWTIVDK